MNIYVKESPQLKIQTLLPIINANISVMPFISVEALTHNDLVILSQYDLALMTDLRNYHTVIFEELFDAISRKITQEYYYNHDYYYLKKALQSAQNSNVTTLISGSSYGAKGIDLDSLENSINLSSISQDLYYSQELLYKACKTNSNIKNIVLCFGYYCFHFDLSLNKSVHEIERLSKVYYPLLQDSHNCLVLPPKQDFCIKNQIINIDYLLDNYASIQYNNGFFNDAYPRENFVVKSWEDKSKCWQNLSVEEQEIAGKIRAEAHNKHIAYMATLNENICLFQDFVHFCNNNSINLLIAIAPATKYYLHYLNPEFKNIFYSILDKVEGTVHLLDLSDCEDFDNYHDFNDADHLNEYGAKKLSHIISSVLHEINC